MVQPKQPPISLRPGDDRLARIDAYAAEHKLTRHAAILLLIDLSLVPAKAPPRAKPTKVEEDAYFAGTMPDAPKAAISETPKISLQLGPANFAPGSRLKKR